VIADLELRRVEHLHSFNAEPCDATLPPTLFVEKIPDEGFYLRSTSRAGRRATTRQGANNRETGPGFFQGPTDYSDGGRRREIAEQRGPRFEALGHAEDIPQITYRCGAVADLVLVQRGDRNRLQKINQLNHRGGPWLERGFPVADPPVNTRAQESSV